MWKKRIAFFVLVVVIALPIVACQSKSCSFADCIDGTLTEIRLHKAVDAAEYVTFRDEDLLEIWNRYLSSTTLTYIREASKEDNNTNGGGPVVTVVTEKGEYSFQFYAGDGTLIRFNDKLYTVDTADNIQENPIEDTYAEAEARHGTKTPWN